MSEAMNLALGIGLQNFPEGLAVSMPLKRAACRRTKRSCSPAMVPSSRSVGSLGCFGDPGHLYYRLAAFAPGAMIYVVVDQLILCAMGRLRTSSSARVHGGSG